MVGKLFNTSARRQCEPRGSAYRRNWGALEVMQHAVSSRFEMKQLYMISKTASLAVAARRRKGINHVLLPPTHQVLSK